MNRANQLNLVQSTNMNLINIRQIEVSYFSTFYSSFGTQAAIVVGIIAGAVSQTPAYNTVTDEYFNQDVNYFWIIMYFIASALTVVFAMQVLLCSTFIGVYGQGLALRGPLGSMVTAIDGMIYEQKQTLMCFVLAIVSFVLSEVGMFFIVMDEVNAIIGAVIILCGGFYTYQIGIRIYNRFKYKSNLEFETQQDPTKDLDELEPKNDPTLNPVIAGAAAKDVPQATITHSGYLTIKLGSSMFKDPWERRYIILRGGSCFYYKDKKSFELSISNPLNKRPIELDGYSLVAGAKEAPYYITLIPLDPESIRKAWKFRCDTLSEFENWIDVFHKAIKFSSGTDESMNNMKDERKEYESDGRSTYLGNNPNDLVVITQEGSVIRS